MSTRCSTARGPARSPSLVTCPTRRRATPLDLGQAGQALDAGAHLRQAAGRLGQRGVGDGLERVDDDEGGRCALDRRLDRLDVGALEREEVAGHRADARGADRCTWVSDSSAEASITSSPVAATEREHLEEERRLADARRAEEQRDRARDHAAAHDAVELAHAGRQRARGVGRDVGQGHGGHTHRRGGPAAPGAPRVRTCSTRRSPGSGRPSAARSPRRRCRSRRPRGARVVGGRRPWRHATEGGVTPAPVPT